MLKKLISLLSRNLSSNSGDCAFVYRPEYNLDLGPHVFPATKYSRIFSMIKNDPILRNIPLYKPPQASHEALRLVHTNEYIEDLFSLHKTASTGYSELPLNSDIVQSFMYSTGGTILATDLTSSFRFVFNLGGGFHHSFPDHAEGFCYLNDAAIATKHYQQKFPGRKVLFIDLDVHQGNGNTFTFRDDPDVFTFSMHQGNLYPKKEISDLDISLHEGCRDEEYLRLLEDSLRKIKAEFKPDLIYYLAGADPFEGDTLGEIKMSFSGLQARDVLVKQFIEETGARAVILTAGGYAKNFEDTCVIHFNTARIFGENSKPAILVKES